MSASTEGMARDVGRCPLLMATPSAGDVRGDNGDVIIVHHADDIVVGFQDEAGERAACSRVMPASDVAFARYAEQTVRRPSPWGACAAGPVCAVFF